ncbi:AraC family transcriptional regulator [Runella salmonicolor]|uniref:AraC family transcriptional regulator n=1 Tax=Runella salmonicolor TaxID=2950278 RepID=A0ABT1FZ87_9BACT|nr:AraC family transcriptional regulator [Runella salmonicolor]MCP1385787.1 AraC family transcriptional regulator [Runella salmonicolor]
MKALLFRVPTVDDRSFRVQVDHDKHFYQRLHFHPEFQLTLIKEGTGTLVVGDRIDRFQPYDLVLLGANVPHVMLNDADYFQPDSPRQVMAYSFFFKESILGDIFITSPELMHIAELLREATHGVRIRFSGPNSLTDRLEKINELRPFEQLMLLLNTLDTLTLTPDCERLSGTSYKNPNKPVDHQRLENVFNFILTNYANAITLDDIAGVANLTPHAFCRFLRVHTRKTFSQLLNEVRIEHACRLLKDSTQSVSQIAFSCGYANLSNFNRQFKQVTGMPPRDYLKRTN